MGDKGLSESENVARSSALNFGKDEEQLTRRQIDFLERRGELHAEAVALAPSVPSGSFSWAEALVRHGKFDGAIAKFEHANARGPHWADPLTVRAGATRSPPRAISGTRGSATNARRNSRRTGPSCICAGGRRWTSSEPSRWQWSNTAKRSTSTLLMPSASHSTAAATDSEPVCE